MSGEKKIVYFDSCIFITWLKNEKRPDPTDMQAVQDIIEKVQKREITIITSTITQTEIAACKVGKGALTTFDDLLKRKNLQRISVDIKIAKIARELRDYYQSEAYTLGADGKRIGSKTFTTADAIHIATAIINKAEALYTFDDFLISLSGNVGGYNLKIQKPPVGQMRLFN